MKILPITIVSLFIIIGLFSCTKTKQNPNTSISIIGKWSVKSDYVVEGVGPIGAGKNYAGVAGDYFDFRTDNKLYIKEGIKLDTFTYTMLSDTKLSLSPVGASINYIPFRGFIDTITVSRLTINWGPSLVNPGSFYSRTVSLDK